MGLNKSKGNMYKFITHTFNVLKGACEIDCSYCYMKRWGKLNPVRFDEKELKTNLGEGNYIFVGSSCDMFSNSIPDEQIIRIFEYCQGFNNKYFFQTKNPERFSSFDLAGDVSLCTTIETNRYYPEFMGNAPHPLKRGYHFSRLSGWSKYLTIEPIMDFDMEEFIEIIEDIDPIQINIGADSGKHNLPEPSKEKTLTLINKLKELDFNINLKSNLKRITV
jgi:DNA repair photolyase